MSQSKIKGVITLVGAGPGDPELISVKGLKALQDADAVYYDALVHPGLVEMAPAHAIKVYVGKRCGRHSLKQIDINRLLVVAAGQYRRVVRLKGGDPFVFGRGQEEVAYAHSFGIKTEVIPGISSVTAAPCLAGFPLTERGVSESFWVLTGTTRKHELSTDITLAAQSNATIVILMGTRKLEEIVKIFRTYRKATEAVALLENSSHFNAKHYFGALENIVERARAVNFKAPGIIVIGAAATQRERIKNEVLTHISQPESNQPMK